VGPALAEDSKVTATRSERGIGVHDDRLAAIRSEPIDEFRGAPAVLRVCRLPFDLLK